MNTFSALKDVSPGFKRILSNMSWLAMDRVIRMALNIFVSVWMTRYLGPTQFGILSYALAFVAVFTPIAVLGLDSITVRELVKSPENRDEILGSSFWMRIWASLGIVVLSSSAIFVVRPHDTQMFYLVLITVIGVVFQSFDVIDYHFQAKVLSKFPVLARNAAFLVCTIIKIIFLLTHASLIYFAIVGSLEFMLAAIGMVLVYQSQELKLSVWEKSTSRIKELLRDGWPLVLSGITIILYMRAGQLIIGYYLDDARVGIFSSAIRLIEIWYFVPMAIISSIFPSLLNGKQKGEEVYHQRLQLLYDFMTGISFVFAVLITFFSDQIISLLYGSKFNGAGPILALYAWSAIPSFLGMASSQYLVIENYTHISFCRTFLGCIVNLCLNFILIPYYGIKGAAWASLISFSIATFMILLVPQTRYQAFCMLKSFNLIRHLLLLKKTSAI